LDGQSVDLIGELLLQDGVDPPVALYGGLAAKAIGHHKDLKKGSNG